MSSQISTCRVSPGTSVAVNSRSGPNGTSTPPIRIVAPAPVVAGREVAALVELAVGRQVGLRRDPQHPPAVDDDRTVEDAGAVDERRADDDDGDQVVRGLHDLVDRRLDAVSTVSCRCRSSIGVRRTGSARGRSPPPRRRRGTHAPARSRRARWRPGPRSRSAACRQRRGRTRGRRPSRSPRRESRAPQKSRFLHVELVLAFSDRTSRASAGPSTSSRPTTCSPSRPSDSMNSRSSGNSGRASTGAEAASRNWTASRVPPSATRPLAAPSRGGSGIACRVKVSTTRSNAVPLPRQRQQVGDAVVHARPRVGFPRRLDQRSRRWW